MKELKRLFLSRSFSALFCKITSALLSFVFMWLVTQSLDINDAGLFLYSYSLMMILVQLSRAGTEHSMLRQLGKNITFSSVKNITNKIIFYVIFASLLLTSLLVLITQFDFFEVYKGEDNKFVLYCFCLITVFFSVTQVFSTYFQTKYEIYSQYWTLNIGLVLIGSLFFITLEVVGLDTSVKWTSFFLVLVSLFVLCTSFFLFFRSVYKIKANLSYTTIPTSFLEVIKFTFPYSILAFMYISVQWGGHFLSSIWLDEKELGLLSVAIRISILVSFVFLAFSSLIAPKIVFLIETNAAEKIYRTSLKNISISSLLGLFICTLFVIFGEFFLGLFGDAYKSAYAILVILSFGNLIRVLFGPVDTIIMMAGRVKVMRKNLYISAFVSLFSSILLIPIYGSVGAACSLFISSSLLCYLNARYVKSNFSIEYFSKSSLVEQVKCIHGFLLRKKEFVED
jgi:O-antigen/teichoic acid export membrane protein